MKVWYLGQVKGIIECKVRTHLKLAIFALVLTVSIFGIAQQNAFATTTPSTPTVNATTNTFFAPFNVQITKNNATNNLNYTIDGTNPTNSITATTITGPTGFVVVPIPATLVLNYDEGNASGNSLIGTQTYTFVSTPTLTITFPTGGSTIGTGSPTFTGTLSSPAGVATLSIDIDGTIASVPIATSWSLPSPIGLANGFHEVNATATDSAGHIVMSTTISFTVDSTAPTVTITSPPTGSTVSSNNPTISGTATDGSTGIQMVQVNLNGTGFVNATSSDGFLTWTFPTINLAQGNYTVDAGIIDNLGHIANATQTFFIVALPQFHPSESPISSLSKPSLGGISGETFTDGLAIDGKTFDISKFTSQIPQQALPLNKPATISVKEELQRGSPFWQHVMVFLNFGGKGTITGNADTWISIDKTDGVQIHDPNGFISHVSAGNDFTAYGLTTTFKFTPVKDMTDSNVIVRVWDNQGRQNDAIVNGAILLGEAPKAPEPAKIPNYLHVYSNLKDADLAVESAGYIKPVLFAHISNSDQIWKGSLGGNVLWFFDTKDNQVAELTYDANGNMLNEKGEELVKATTILIGKDTSYAGNHLDRQNVDQMKQAQKDQEMRALITMESFGYPVYYSK